MKRIYKYLFVFLGSLFMFPLVSNAECSYERQAELSKIASNVQFSYTYDSVNDMPKFNVIITNLTNDIYIKDDSMNTIIGTGEKNYQYENGTSVTYKIYSNDPSCRNEQILTKYINLPAYNAFSNTEECIKNPNFDYCQVWTSTGLKAEDFETKYEQYQNELEEKEKQNEQKGTIEIIKLFIQNNLNVIIMCLIAVLILLTMFIYRKIKK